MKKVLIGITLVITFLGFAEQTTPVSTENAAAVVNGYVITKDFLDVMSDLKRILIGIHGLDEKFFSVLTGTDEGLIFLLRYKLEILNDLIDQLLIQQLADREGVLPSDEEVRRYVESEISKMLSDMKITEKDFDEFLKQTGTSLKAMKIKLMWVYKTKKALEGLMSKVTSDVKVTEDEVRSYYESHKEDFKTPPAVKLLVIVLKSQDDAHKALERLMNGEEFSSVASDMSVDEGTKSKGGELGWVVQGSKEANEKLDGYQDKIFMAPKGAILGPYKIGSEWYIFRVIDKREGSYPAFEDVKDTIKEKLLQEKKERIWREWYKTNMEKFRKESQIEVFMGKK